MGKWLKKIFKLNKQKNIANEQVINEQDIGENKKIKINSIYQYKFFLKKDKNNFDFSELNLEFEDIQDIDLENLNLDINLRNIFVPYNGSVKIGNSILNSVFSSYSGDYYLQINNSRLGGNNVTGDLTFFEGTLGCSPVYIWYSEETFDDKYKSQYPQFFISKDAPEELREKYYNPRIIYETTNEQDGIILDLKEKNEDTKILVRQTLTLDEYLKYYKFLKGKYLGNFSISPQDLLQIETIEKYGLEQRDEIIKDITNMMNNINQTTDCENYTINEQEEKGISLTLKHK